MTRNAAGATAPATSRLPGLAVAAALAATAYGTSAVAGFVGLPVGPMLAALLLGLVVAQLRPLPEPWAPGLDCAGRPLLRFAIVLSGLRLGTTEFATVGWNGLAAVAVVVASTLATGVWLGRRLHLGGDLVWLLAAGHAICGAAAVAAADSVLRCRPRDVTAAVTLVTLAGTFSMLVLPALGAAGAMPVGDYGFWVGTSVHEVAQALAAGHARGQESGDLATLVKMTRVLFLLPLGLVLGQIATRRPGHEGRRWIVPWFVLGFAAVGGLANAGLVPRALAAPAESTGSMAMTVAMAAIGLQSPLRDLAALGRRPLVATVVLSGFVTIVGWLVATVR